MKSSTLGSIPANRQSIIFTQAVLAGTTNVDGTVWGSAPARGAGKIVEVAAWNAKTALTGNSTMDCLIQRVPGSVIADPTVTGVPIPLTLATGLQLTSTEKKMVRKLGTLITEAEIIGKATAGGASTITIAAVTGMIDGQIVDADIELVGGTGVGQKNKIVKYIKSTEVATVKTAWATQPDNTTIYRIKPKNQRVNAGDLFQCAFDFTVGTGAAGADAFAEVVIEFDERIQ